MIQEDNRRSCGPGNHLMANPVCQDCGVDAEKERIGELVEEVKHKCSEHKEELELSAMRDMWKCPVGGCEYEIVNRGPGVMVTPMDDAEATLPIAAVSELDFVNNLADARSWFLGHLAGALRCVRDDGKELVCTNFLDAERFYRGRETESGVDDKVDQMVLTISLAYGETEARRMLMRMVDCGLISGEDTVRVGKKNREGRGTICYTVKDFIG